MILITGAAGKTGRAIIKALRKRNVAVRAFVRQNTASETVQSLGVNDVIFGDLLDITSLMRAAQGVRAIYHIAPNMHPAEIAMGKNAIDIAQAADVERLVYHSVLHPQIKAMPHHWDKLRVEEMLCESHLPSTILQPAAYMQNILSQGNRIVNQGRFQIPYPSSTRMSIVDLHDIAEVAAITLTEPGHIGATYELAGPSALSQDDIATQLGAQIGRNVQAVSISHKEWRNNARQSGLGDDVIDKLIAMFKHYARFDFTGNPNVLHWLLGKSPTSFADFIKREFKQRNLGLELAG